MLTAQEQVELAQLKAERDADSHLAGGLTAAEEEELRRLKHEQAQEKEHDFLKGIGRMVVGGLTGIADLPGAIVNIPSIIATGKSVIPSVSHAATEKYDELVGDEGAPRSLPEKIAHGIGETLIGGGALRKGVRLAEKGAHLAHPYLKKTAEFIQNLTAPTPTTIGAVAGGTTAANVAHELKPDSERLPLLFGLLGGRTGAGVARKGQYLAQTAKNATEVTKGLPSLRDLRRQAALKDDYGKLVESQLPMYYGLEEGFIGQPSMREIGNLASKSAERYTERKRQDFEKEYGKLDQAAQKHFGKHPESRVVSLGKPIDRLVEAYKDAALDAGTASEFLSGPLGSELKRLIGHPQISNDALKKIIKANSPILNREVDYKTASVLRKNLDGRLNHGGWEQVGGNPGILKEVRYGLMEASEAPLKETYPKLYTKYKDVNAAYRNHMEYEVPWVEDIRKVQHHRGETASRALRDVQTTAEDLERFYRDLNPGEKKTLSDFLLRDLGSDDGKVSSRTLTRNLEKIQDKEAFTILKNAMKEDEWEKVAALKKAQENLQAIRLEPKGFSDIPNRTPALSWKQRIRKAALKKLWGEGLQTPESMAETMKFLENYEPREIDFSALRTSPPKTDRKTRYVVGALTGLKP